MRSSLQAFKEIVHVQQIQPLHMTGAGTSIPQPQCYSCYDGVNNDSGKQQAYVLKWLTMGCHTRRTTSKSSTEWCSAVQGEPCCSL